MKIEIDTNVGYIATDRAWQKCVGSGHAYLAHRRDWTEYLKRVHDELGIEYVRFHGILDDDMLTVQRTSDFIPLPGASKIKEYSFAQVGKVYDNVLAAGMKPFVEISFIPSALASGRRTGLHYKNNITPPKDYRVWYDYIRHFIHYLIKRYGKVEVESWYFEVWNEPDLKIFFTGDQKEYFKLYSYTVRAIKSIDGNLRVGGPSTSAGKWITDFLIYVRREGLPCDFISTHQYPGDGFGNEFKISDVFTRFPKVIKEGVKKQDGVAQVNEKLFFDPANVRLTPKGIMAEAVKKAKREAGDIPLFYTEWNCMSVFGAPAQDEKYSAAYATKTILDMDHETDCFSFWCCNDLFEETMFINTPFHGGFGLLSNQGIPKPVFWALKMQAQLFDKRLDLPRSTNEDVEYAVFTDGEKLQIMLYAQEIDYEVHKDFSVELVVYGVYEKATAVRIDDTHCNPKRIWQEMGAPMDLTPQQVRKIKEKSVPVEELLDCDIVDGKSHIRLELTSNDIIMITLE